MKRNLLMRFSLAAALIVIMAAGCINSGSQQTPAPPPQETEAPPAETETAAPVQETEAPPAETEAPVAEETGVPQEDKLLVIAADASFEEKWNPFIVESAYDHLVIDQIFVPILQINDRNEAVPYGGSVTSQSNDDGTVLYTVTVNQGMTFTNGDPVTIDDYIYSLYVRADPSYTGAAGSLLGAFIEGLENYYYDDINYESRLAEMEAEADAKYTTENISLEDFIIYAQGTNLDGWWDGDPAGDAGGVTWSEYAEGEGFGEQLAAIDSADAAAMLALIAEIEWTNYRDAYDTYNWFLDKMKSEYALGGLEDGVDVPEISGITRIDDYTCTVKYTQVDIYGDRGLGTQNASGNLVPKDYYGAFEKGDVSNILSNMLPVGSGPYKWEGFEDNIATCTANNDFFLGQPKIGTVRWQYVPTSEHITALASGMVDISNPTGNQSNVVELEALPQIRVDFVDNAGYGYMAMNTQRVPLLVRKGFWSLMNRAPSVDAYYGPIAQVIERPMTTTLAEYPQGATQYYPYSKDEALRYFNEAGYTQQDGKLADADGNQLVLNCYIGGEGEGDHPAYAMLVQAAEDMKELGGEIQIQDVQFNVLQGAMNDGTADAWIMAWGSVYDCDKSSQFRSTGSQNRYRFSDSKMDQLLDQIVQTIDLDARRALVAEMLDYAMDQCLELPLYQRKNLLAYNIETVDTSTIPVATTAADYQNVLWQLDLVQK
ncbi:MAG: ABC transporter substrate-binding protein [Clostridiales bacterium]|jgi:peptide/nickel transport system substrate-binding protein|nr:ABC transporter substrate-binding protein [Clostridiales bacterium]